MASKKVSNDSGSTLYITRADMRIYALAIVATADRIFFCFLKTFAIMPKLFEYRKNLNARRTFKVLNNLKSLSNLKPLFRTDIEGSIESKSITAIGVIGYTKNDATDLLLL